MHSEQYAPGISCPYCYDKLSEEKRASLIERQKQVALAKKRGEAHIGSKQHRNKQKHDSINKNIE
jgi:UPF0176 protein